jgi:hypothetical protein
MKYLLRVVYERFYEADAKTLLEAKADVIERTVDHICSLSATNNHSVFSVEEYTPPSIESSPGRRKDDVTVSAVFKSKGL